MGVPRGEMMCLSGCRDLGGLDLYFSGEKDFRRLMRHDARSLVGAFESDFGKLKNFATFDLIVRYMRWLSESCFK